MPEPTLFEPARAVKPRNQSGSDNNNWRGGRSVASNGYVLIRVGVGHHLADVRGYAYEHRVEAEKKIGRPLQPGELVHHKNENKQDNRQDNLDVCAGNAEHFVHHRTHHNRRLPGEDNPVISCACGCGQVLDRYDESGRPRKFITGHNGVEQPAPTKLAVLACLASGPRRRRDIIAELNATKHAVAVCLTKLKRQGLVQRTEPGVWQLRA